MADKQGLGLVTLTAETLKGSDILTRNGILDIVTVHGLCGDRQTSWSEKSHTSWLQDHLPAYLAHARVSTYGYELSEEGVSAAEIDAKAKELLDTFLYGKLAETYYPRTFVFIGHNLGGLIIKQALLRANAEAIYSNIAKRTSLLILFGTPQRAESQVDWETLAHNLIHATGQNNTGPQSQILTRSSFALRDVNERYAKLARTYNVISICENVKLESFGKLVFERDASTMNVPNETVLFRYADHLNMCRGLEDTDDLFTTICDRLVTSITPDSLHIDCLLTLSLLSRRFSTSPSALSKYSEPEWLRTDENYTKFIDSQCGILQLYGRSGSGLSVLSSFLPKLITDSVRLRESTTSTSGQEVIRDPILISFSFDPLDYNTCCTSALFASLTHQLLGVDPGYFKYIRHIYKRISEENWSLEILWALFRSTILGSAVRPTYCVIDAIENCDPERNHFLRDFLKLAQSEVAKLKIIFTNTTGDINKYPFNFSIDVDERKYRQKALEASVEREIRELTRLRPGFESCSDDIQRKVLDRIATDPSFLFISLLFKYLHDDQTRSTPAKMQSVVADMPLSVAEIYQKVFIPSKPSSDWKFKALSWIVHAFRPLNSEELSTALAIDYSSGVFNLDESNRPQAVNQDLKRVFGTFLNIQGNEVSLVHESARGILLESSKDWDYATWDGTDTALDQEKNLFYGHARISNICLDYLQNAEWEELAADVGDSTLKSLPSTDGASSLFSYAARYWYVHYRLAEESQRPLDKARRFLEDEERRTLWAHVEWLEGNRLATRRDTSDPLKVAAELGLNDVLLSMLQVNSKDDDTHAHVLAAAARRGDLELIKELEGRGFVATDSDPLRLAAEKGHLHIVKHLLPSYKRGDPDSLKIALGAALHAASQSGYDDIVEELLQSKTDPNALVNGLTPLHRAAELGNMNICSRLLRETDVHINAATANDEGSTPLHLATLSGQLLTIQLLLDPDRRANIDSEDKASLRPLHQAAASGLVDAVELLISRQAPIDSVDNEGKTALHVAAEGSHTRSVRALLAGGANVNITARGVGAPLHVVARTGNLEIAMLLLGTRGCITNINLLEDNIETPLCLAARYGHTTLVELLLEFDSDIDESDEWHETLRKALQLAAANGSFGTAKAILRLLDSEDFDNKDLFSAPLLAAAMRGNLPTVKALVRLEAPPIGDNEAFMSLHAAAYNGDVEVISALLEAGLCLGDDPTDEITPLHQAVESGNLRAAQMLLGANADIDTQDPSNGRTALLQAAARGHTDIVKVLLEAGATVKVADDTGSSFLHCAARGGRIEIVDLALKVGGNILETDQNGLIPLHIAVEERFVDAVTKFLALQNASDQVKARVQEMERTPLHLAAEQGNVEVVTLLLKVDREINLVDTNELTALHLASENGHTEIAKLLLKDGANPDMTDDCGRTPLFIAFERGNLDMIRLLEPKTDLKATNNKTKTTLLHLAAESGMLTEVDNLISLGLDIEALNSDGCTPISLAADSGHFDVVKALLKVNAKLNYLDGDKKTVLSRAISSGNSEMVLTLLSEGAEPELEGTSWPALYTAAYYRRIDLVRNFIDRKLDLERKGGSSGWTPLHAAFDSPEVTTILLDAGAKTDVVGNDGRTLLDLAVSNYQPETVKIYLDRGLDPLKRRSIDGKTPLHIAVERWNDRSLSLILERVKGETTLDIKDNEGRTPLQHAIGQERETSVTALLSTFKCDMNQKDNEGRSLLVQASDLKNWEIVGILVEKGADIESSLGVKLLNEAVENESWGLIQLLLKKGTETDQPLRQKLLTKALLSENEEIIMLVLRKETSAGATTPEEASEEMDLKMIRLLIDRLVEGQPEIGNKIMRMVDVLIGRVVRIEPEMGNRLMKLAAEYGSLFLVDTLLGKQIEYAIAEDEHRWIPEIFAQAFQHPDVAEKLQKAREKADFTVKMQAPSELGAVPSWMSLKVDDTRLVVESTTLEEPYDKIFCVLANHPIPLLSKSFYFEIEVLDEGTSDIIGIGLATEGSPRIGMPGWRSTSWGYHGDDGKIFHGAYWGRDYADQTYGKNDFVGCLYDFEKKELSFTHNGTVLGTAFQDVYGRLFPVIGLGRGSKVQVNFGKSEFKYKEEKGEKEKRRARRN
ncbi:MAG: Ankyrin repeat domain-containing protein 44 [Geoglossum umbratile]|nr:MAG: Ankyrin repeat domain-containing protein 44 [Geoglossum umbratile]